MLAKEQHQVASKPKVVVDHVPSSSNLDDIPDLDDFVLHEPKGQPPKQLLATEQPPSPDQTMEAPPQHASGSNAWPMEQPPEQVGATNEQPPEQVEATNEQPPQQVEATNAEPAEQVVVTSEELPPSQMLRTPTSSRKRSVQYNDDSRQVIHSVVCPSVHSTKIDRLLHVLSKVFELKILPIFLPHYKYQQIMFTIPKSFWLIMTRLSLIL